MAELLVRVFESPDYNAQKHGNRVFRPGDVIVVCPDGHPWTSAEINHPEWRVLKLIGVTVQEVSDLLELLFADILGGEEPIREFRGKRRRYFDISHPSIQNKLGPTGTILTFSTTQEKLALFAAKLERSA